MNYAHLPLLLKMAWNELLVVVPVVVVVVVVVVGMTSCARGNAYMQACAPCCRHHDVSFEVARAGERVD
jgi:hypothetical protein